MASINDEQSEISLENAGQALRQRAVAALGEEAESLGVLSPEQVRAMLHELRVHQIELEMQNEELRRTQDELEYSRARYFDLYNLAPVSYLTLSEWGMIREANLIAASLFGVPRGELLRQPLSRFIAPEDHDRYYRHRKLLAETGEPQVCELRLLRNGHAPRWVSLETTVAQADVHGATLCRAVMSDITARKQAEEGLHELNATLERRVDERTAALQQHAEALSRANAELARALRLKDEFLAMMSHELRTPLNVVLSMTEALVEELYGPLSAKQRQVLVTVNQSGHHLLAILSDILDLARITAGTEVLDPTPIDIDSLCRAAMQFVAPAAQAKDVRIRYTLEHSIQGLRADERRLTQILVNLLDNAVKFTPHGGTVSLEVRANAAEEQLRFSVRDTGIGIADADVARIFAPFTQVDGRLARSYGGIGLGLTLVRRLVDLHGGSISLESTPGQGSHFTVSLPWAAGDNAAPVAPRPQADGLRVWAHPPRVVIADDHEPTLALYDELLSRQGCQVATARTGEEAVAQVRAHRPDLAVLDIQMPGMDGLTAIRQIRADPALAAVPIIALTALAMPGDRERCLAAGAQSYLAKPVGLRVLIEAITALLPPEEPAPPG